MKMTKKRMEIIAWRVGMVLFCIAFWLGVYFICK